MTNANVDPWKMRHCSNFFLNFFEVIKFFTFVLGIPYFLFSGIMLSWANNSELSMYGHADPIIDAQAHFYWLISLAMIGQIILNQFIRRYRLKKILSTFKIEEEFNPGSGNEVIEWGHHAYLGLDIHHGTMLYVRFVGRKKVDIMGFTMSNWKEGSLTGSILTINTNYVDCPWISIRANETCRLFDKLSVMRDRYYDYPDNWPDYVRSAGQNIAKELGLTFIPY